MLERMADERIRRADRGGHGPASPRRRRSRLAATLNGHVFAGPTTLTGDNGDVCLPAAQVAENSSVVAVDGGLEWQVDGAALSAFILDAYP